MTNPKPPRHRPPVRRGVRLWAEIVSAEFRLARKQFTAANIRNLVRNIVLWVAPLTILIWIYAERNETTDVTNVGAHIEVKRDNPDYAVTVETPFDKNVLLNLSGPNTRVQSVIAELKSANPLIIDLGALTPGQNIPIKLMEYIENNPLFIANGVTVEDIKPAEMMINVDKLRTEQFTVTAPENLNLEATTFTPATVSVRAPSSLFDQLNASAAPHNIMADVAGLDSINVPGEHTVNNIPLIKPWPDNPFVTIEPQTVSAVLMVKSADVDWVIPRIPLFVTMPYQQSKQYVINFDQDSPFMANVHVKGPPAAKAAMEGSGYTGLSGQIVIEDPKSGSHGQATVNYKLPPGVVCTDDEAHRSVGYTVADRGG